MSIASRRILHLADPSWPGGGPCALRMLALASARLTHDNHVTLVLGNRADLEVARRCGVDPIGHVPLPGGFAPLARRSLARAVRAIVASAGDFAIVHAWSPRAALLCDACPGARAVATCAIAPVEGMHAELLGAALTARPMPLLASTTSVRHELLALGVEPSLVTTLPPGVDTRAPDPPLRRRVRRRWGVDDRTFVLGLVGDPVEWTDARGAVFLLSLLRAAGHQAHLVMHPHANRGDHMVRWGAPLGFDRHMTLDPEVAKPWSIAPALDVALLLGDETTAIEPRPLGSPLSLLLGGGRPSRPMAGVLPLLWTGAAGVPALAEASLAAAGIIEEGVTGLLVEPRRIEAAARRLMTLLEDPQTRGRLGNAARARIAETHAISAMTVRLRQVYDCLVAGRRVPTALEGVDSEDDLEQVRWRSGEEAGKEARARAIARAARARDRGDDQV